MKTIKGYHDLYLKCYVLLSTDLFEKSRNYVLKELWIMPKWTSLRLGCNAQYNKSGTLIYFRA